MNIQNPNTACEHGHQRRKCPYCELSFLLEELLKQRDAALKLADKWEAEAKDTSKSNTVRFTFYGCASELRDLFAPKEGK